MRAMSAEANRIRSAWQGRISGCILGKPVEVLSFQEGRSGLEEYLREAGSMPLRNYVPVINGTVVERLGHACCRGNISRAEPDDDINYTFMALLLLEENGSSFDTADVARAWLRRLPAGTTWTAERAAYSTLLSKMDEEFVNGSDAGFDLDDCSDNEYNEWIGAQIRADLYGWVCPGSPALAAKLAKTDASLSHRGEGVNGAMFIAALGAAIPASASLDAALEAALEQIPANSKIADSAKLGRALSDDDQAVDKLHEEFAGMPPVHSINNLAVVIWALFSAPGDFASAVGNAVMAGWDTDCNGATVGGLFGLTGATIPSEWTEPWAGRIGVDLAGYNEVTLEDVVDRTLAVARTIRATSN